MPKLLTFSRPSMPMIVSKTTLLPLEPEPRRTSIVPFSPHAGQQKYFQETPAKLLHVFVRQNFIQEHSPKKDMLFRLVVIGNTCSLYPTAVERMRTASTHIKHTVIEHHNGIIRLQGFSCHHTLTDFQYTLHTGIITIGHFAFTHQVIYQIAKIIPCHLFIYSATEIVRRTIELTNRRSYNAARINPAQRQHALHFWTLVRRHPVSRLS